MRGQGQAATGNVEFGLCLKSIQNAGILDCRKIEYLVFTTVQNLCSVSSTKHSVHETIPGRHSIFLLRRSVG